MNDSTPQADIGVTGPAVTGPGPARSQELGGERT